MVRDYNELLSEIKTTINSIDDIKTIVDDLHDRLIKMRLEIVKATTKADNPKIPNDDDVVFDIYTNKLKDKVFVKHENDSDMKVLYLFDSCYVAKCPDGKLQTFPRVQVISNDNKACMLDDNINIFFDKDSIMEFLKTTKQVPRDNF